MGSSSLEAVTLDWAAADDSLSAESFDEDCEDCAACVDAVLVV